MDRERFGRNKYALIKNRKLDEIAAENGNELPANIAHAMALLLEEGVLDVGDRPETEFFVMRLKDRYAGPALLTYANHAAANDIEYAGEVNKLSKRAGMAHPNCKNPD